jgi:hypothetical protein
MNRNLQSMIQVFIVVFQPGRGKLAVKIIQD